MFKLDFISSALLHPHVSSIRIHSHAYFLEILLIFVYIKLVFSALLTLFTRSLSSSPTFSLWAGSLFGSASECSACVMLLRRTACVKVKLLVCYFDFCISPFPSKHIRQLCFYHIERNIYIAELFEL